MAPSSRHGRMTVAMPSAIVSTIRPATGTSMGAGAGAGPCIMPPRASSGSRPVKKTKA